MRIFIFICLKCGCQYLFLRFFTSHSFVSSLFSCLASISAAEARKVNFIDFHVVFYISAVQLKVQSTSPPTLHEHNPKWAFNSTQNFTRSNTDADNKDKTKGNCSAFLQRVHEKFSTSTFQLFFLTLFYFHLPKLRLSFSKENQQKKICRKRCGISNSFVVKGKAQRK